MAECGSSCSNFILIGIVLAGLAILYSNTGRNGCAGYNGTPLDTPKKNSDGSVSHNIIIVTDLDHHSLVSGKKPAWKSTLKRGTLRVWADKATVEWGTEATVSSQLAVGGRGMELSDLVVFDGKLLSIDDRTGVVYRITSDNKIVPWVFLNDGPGDTGKGLKGEWMTVKGCELWVGGLGKEWTTTEGVFVNHHPMYVKKVRKDGAVDHVRWVDQFISIRQAAGVVDPGYMIHEAVQWSDVHQKWFFMPRRVSEKELYTEETDEFKGSNHLLVASEDFSEVEVKTVGQKGDGCRGFSAFQFVPGTNDELIVAIKSEEKKATPTGSYMTVFNWKTGKVLLEEQQIGHDAVKFEGIAFASPEAVY